MPDTGYARHSNMYMRVSLTLYKGQSKLRRAMWNECGLPPQDAPLLQSVLKRFFGCGTLYSALVILFKSEGIAGQLEFSFLIGDG